MRDVAEVDTPLRTTNDETAGGHKVARSDCWCAGDSLVECLDEWYGASDPGELDYTAYGMNAK